MKENKMKATKRKRRERRLRILEKNVKRRRARERAAASEARRDRRMAHRKNLVTKLDEAIRSHGKRQKKSIRRKKQTKRALKTAPGLE